MNVLLAVVRAPERLASLSEGEWDRLIRFARYAKMVATIAEMAAEQGLLENLPDGVAQQLQGERRRIAFIQQQARHEMDCLQRRFAGCDYRVLLLKGGAYVAAGLPPAQGRRLSDVDVLVGKAQLADAERRLTAGGWQYEGELTAYDEHYYREWMHEVPPLRYPTRHLEVDLHHNLMPPVSRIKLNADRLIESAVPIADTGFYRLCDEDLYLHSAVHLFYGDELRGGLRDLVDMYRLGGHFNRDGRFWGRLTARAEQLGLQRPLYYALICQQHLLGLSLTEEMSVFLRRAAPVGLVRLLMTRLLVRELAPGHVGTLGKGVAHRLLFVRSHWVKMPPIMLIKHLLYKARYRVKLRRQPE